MPGELLLCLAECQDHFTGDEELSVVGGEAEYLVRLVGGFQVNLLVGEFVEPDDEDAGCAAEDKRILVGLGDSSADDVISFEKSDEVHGVVGDFDREQFALREEFRVEVEDVDDVREYDLAGFDSRHDGDRADGGRQIRICEFSSGEVDTAGTPRFSFDVTFLFEGFQEIADSSCRAYPHLFAEFTEGRRFGVILDIASYEFKRFTLPFCQPSSHYDLNYTTQV